MERHRHRVSPAVPQSPVQDYELSSMLEACFRLRQSPTRDAAFFQLYPSPVVAYEFVIVKVQNLGARRGDAELAFEIFLDSAGGIRHFGTFRLFRYT